MSARLPLCEIVSCPATENSMPKSNISEITALRAELNRAHERNDSARRAIVELVDRAEAAEARVAELEKVLEKADAWFVAYDLDAPLQQWRKDYMEARAAMQKGENE